MVGLYQKIYKKENWVSNKAKETMFYFIFYIIAHIFEEDKR